VQSKVLGTDFLFGNQGMPLIGNTATCYGLVSIVLHWLSFLMVCGLFALGLYMVGLTYYDPLYHVLPEWHKLWGVVLALITLVRLLWKVFNPRPKLLSGRRWEVYLARGMHALLYCLLLLLFLTGYLITVAEGKALSAFEYTLVPALLELSPQQADWAGVLHRGIAWLLMSMIGLHGAAACKHHFIDRDSTLMRILIIKDNSQNRS